MRIGVRVPQYGSTWAELREAALRIEALGFDGIWVNDHLQSPGRDKHEPDRKSTRLNSSHIQKSRMPSSA